MVKFGVLNANAVVAHEVIVVILTIGDNMSIFTFGLYKYTLMRATTYRVPYRLAAS